LSATRGCLEVFHANPGSGPSARNRDAAAARSALLADFSLDITAKELGELVPARAVIPAGTSVQLSFPDGADLAERASTAQAIKEAGFTPVPIIAARRLPQQMLRQYLAALRTANARESVLVVAGDPAQPQGPYPDAASGASPSTCRNCTHLEELNRLNVR